MNYIRKERFERILSTTRYIVPGGNEFIVRLVDEGMSTVTVAAGDLHADILIDNFWEDAFRVNHDGPVRRLVRAHLDEAADASTDDYSPLVPWDYVRIDRALAGWKVDYAGKVRRISRILTTKRSAIFRTSDGVVSVVVFNHRLRFALRNPRDFRPAVRLEITRALAVLHPV